MDLSILSEAKSKSKEIRKEISKSTYEDGVKLLDEFTENNDFNLLKQSAKIFSEAMEFNKEDARSYIYLGYIFYLLENNEFALKYFDQAEKLIPLPEEIKEIKTNIESTLSYQRMDKSITNTLSSMSLPSMKVKVNEKSSFWKIFSKK